MARKNRRSRNGAVLHSPGKFHTQKVGTSQYRERLKRRGVTSVSVRMEDVHTLRKRAEGMR